MSRTFKLAVGGCLLAEVTANFVSPGLGKCLDLEKECLDGTHDDCKKRETIEEMMEDEKTNVQLYTCHGDDNQHFRIVDGQFQSFAMEGFCLTATAIEDNSDVHLEKCVDGKDEQQWDLTGDGYIKVKDSEKCLDVVAEKKDDGTREVWNEIKEHKTVNVHLYECHDVSTERVNQLWSWVPYRNGDPVTAKTEKPIVDQPVEPLEIQGSMPDNVDAADELANGELAGVLDNYAIGRVHMSSAAALASVASAAVLGAAAASAFAHRRRASVAESELLMVAEE